MPNPILEQINNGSKTTAMNNTYQLKQQIQPAKQALRQIMSLSNPQAMMNQMLMNNPKVQQALSFIKQTGNNPQEAFINLAKQKGIDPQEFMNELMSQ